MTTHVDDSPPGPSRGISGNSPISDSIRVLAVGDVYGSLGRRAARRLLPKLRAELRVDLVIVNGENSAGGRGISMRTARELRDSGADIITTGNHVWAQPDIRQVLEDDDLRVVRPGNFPDPAPGNSSVSVVVKGKKVTVANFMGRIFMEPLDDPFRAIDALLFTLDHNPESGERPIVIVDFHAEATSEKQAFAWYVDGRVSAVFGTHTHVPTADGRVLPGGTGYITDLGMTGPRDSIIGATIEQTIQRFLTQRSVRLQTPESGDAVFNAVIFDIDARSGMCLDVQRVDRQDAGGIDGDARAQRRAH